MRVHLPVESRLLFLVALLSGILVSLGGQALATPLFSLETEADWDAALGTTIGPVEDPYPALEYHYGTPGADFLQVPPDLYVYGDIESGGLGDGLMMSWGDPAGDPAMPQVASWEYVYEEDPDLTGTLLSLSVFAPAGIMSVSLTLNDALGGWVSWDWNVGAAGPIFPGTPYTVVIDPTLIGPQSGSTSFAATDPTGLLGPALPWFDVTKTISIVADELAVGPGLWVTFPPAPVIGGSSPWNYWSGLQVQQIPEPSSIILWSLIVLAFGGFAWRRRRKA